MTIEKGKAWGRTGALPADGVVVDGDAALRSVVEDARRASRPVPPIGLLGGDLWRTLGGPAVAGGGEARLRSEVASTFTVDLVTAWIDDWASWFVSHLVARSPLWGRAFVAMNAQWLGEWNVGPRAHPNDGVIDCYESRLGLRDRLQVRERLPLGAHLPHPGISERRGREIEVDLGRAQGVWLDGERVTTARRLRLVVEPDALTIVV